MKFFLSLTLCFLSGQAFAQMTASLLEERKAVFDRALATAHAIAVETKDSTALLVDSCIRSLAILGIPGKNGAIFSQSTGDRAFLAVIPLFTEDCALGYVWKHYVLQKNVEASFSKLPSIKIRPLQAMRDTYFALTILHEEYHAFRYLSHLYRNQRTDEYMEEEVLAYAFELELLSKLGGPKYAALLKSEVANLKQRGCLGLGTKQPVYVLPSTYAFCIDDLLGPSLSLEEEESRQLLVWFNVYFTYIDQSKLRNKTQLKRDVVFYVYRTLGTY